MKIIKCSNFDDETFNEYVIAEGIKLKALADVMCAALINKFCPTGREQGYYRVVEDDYKLHTWEP